MPYFLRKQDGNTCVVKGTKEDPGEVVKCHSTRKKALAHMAALYVHVEDAAKEEDTHMLQETSGAGQYKDAIIGILRLYKEEKNGNWQDRWIAVSTVQMWDRQGEMFTTEAMDYDASRAHQTKEFPELRMFHVRGFKLGVCDSMQRINEYAVDQGYWHDTPFAQAVKEIVAKNKGRWKISRGFYTVKASGLCPDCGAGLTVGPINYIVGVPCRVCKEWYAPSKLKQLKHLETRTFDITLTDVPAVVQTAVAAYTIGSQ